MTRHERLTLIAAILGSGIVFLDGTVVNIALPAITNSLHTDYSGLQWIVDGYLLTLSAMILFGGSLGDVIGQRRVFIGGLIGFGLASLLCGLSPNITFLTIARLIQGIFGALLVPSSLAVINTTFPPAQRSKAIGQWTGFSGIFTALGPLAAGLLVAFSWRWIFLINIPLVLACLYAIKQGVVDVEPSTSPRKLDIVGAALAILSLGGITYALIEGPSHGWSGLTIAVLLGSVLSSFGFMMYEKQHKDPLIPFDIFKSRNFTGANLATLGMYAALSGALLSVILYLQTAVHYTALQAGLAFIPITMLMFFLSGRMGALAAKYGARTFMTVGPIVAGLGFLLMLRLTALHSNYFIYLLPAVIIFGLGLSITVAPLTATVMSSVDEHHSGIASAINNAASRVAGLLIVAFLGIVVVQETTHNINVSSTKLSPAAVEAVNQATAGGIKPSDISRLASNEQTATAQVAADTQRSIFRYAIFLNALLAFSAGLISYIFIRKPKTK